MVSFSQRLTTHAVASSQGVNWYAAWKPVMLWGRPKRWSSEVVAVRFSGASWRSIPYGVSNRPKERARPLPRGATPVRLNRCKLTSVVAASLPNCSVQGAPPLGQPKSGSKPCV